MLKDQEQARQAVSPAEYQAVFSSQAGRKVLNDILLDLCYYDRAETDEERVLNNYAKQLLCNLNVYVEDNSEHITTKILEAIRE